MEEERQKTIKRLLTLLQTEYPNSFVNMDSRMLKLKRELWEKEFANDDLNIVYAAIRTYMRSPERFAPTIGQIREKMDMLTAPAQLSEVAAWALVSKACSSGRSYKEEFDKFPPEVQKAVGSPQQLHEWAMMEAETVQSVIASNFMRSYRTAQQRAKEMAMIPAEVREMLSSVTGNMQLPAAQQQLPAPEPQAPTEIRPIAPPASEPVIPDAAELFPRKEAYTPPTEEEFEKKREEALRRLIGG